MIDFIKLNIVREVNRNALREQDYHWCANCDNRSVWPHHERTGKFFIAHGHIVENVFDNMHRPLLIGGKYEDVIFAVCNKCIENHEETTSGNQAD